MAAVSRQRSEEEAKDTREARRNSLAGPAGPQGAVLSLAKKKAGNKWGLPDDASNPMTWIRGIGGEAKRFLVDPMVKTLSGQEALGNYLNPEGGFGPTRMAERAVGVMNDAMNIASLIPGVNAVARGSVAAENALARAMAGKAMQSGGIVVPFSNRAATMAQSAADEMSSYSQIMKDILDDSSNADEALRRYTAVENPTDPNVMRVWHTNMLGEPLPEKLFSMKEAARLSSRRSPGKSMLLSGGPYATDSRSVSATYGTRRNANIPIGRTIPNVIRDYAEELGISLNELKGVPLKNLKLINQSGPGKYVDIKSSVPPESKLRLGASLGPNPFAAANLDLDVYSKNYNDFNEIFNKLDTWEDFLNFRYDDPSIAHLITPPNIPWEAKLMQESGGILSFSPENPTMLDFPNRRELLGPGATQRGILVDRDNPFVLGDVTVGGRWAPGQNYWDLPIKRSGPAITEMGGMRALDFANMPISQLDELVDIAYRFVDKYKIPGSNIPNIAMKNMDSDIQEYVSTFLDPTSNDKQKLESIRGIIGSAINAAKSTGNMPQDLVSVIDSAGKNLGSETLDPKEVFYQFLTDEMDINAMPHPGGVTVGGAGEHQAVVFNRPELLPPSTYVPPQDMAFRNALDRYNQARYQKYYNNRINKNAGRQFVGARNVSRVPSPILLPLGAGALSSTAGSRR